MGLTLNRAPRYAPRPPRVAISFEASLFLSDNRELPVLIKNISDHGFMAEVPVELEPGTCLGLALPGYAVVRFEVRWSSAGCLGAEFHKLIPVQHLERLARRSGG